ncbi:hypothetical protein ACFYOK_12425 [Microbispora bryophytorum]|uniref:hypothetical protein n=1 Tax=Microbispora bryophytorum TaxID=1460882 RepID=UPI0033E9D9CC
MVELLGAVVSLAAVAALVLGAVVVIAIATLIWLGAMAVSTGRESYGRVTPVSAGADTSGKEPVSASGRAPVSGSGRPPVNASGNGHVSGRAAGRGVDRPVRTIAASARRA